MNLKFINKCQISLEITSWIKITSVERARPTIEQLIFFHDHTIIILVSITTVVIFIIISIIFNKLSNHHLLENQPTEIIWTILPAIILIFIAIPSLKILYLIEEIINPIITVKAIGHQWYWNYEYSDNKHLELESYIKQDLSKSSFRLLDVDNRIPLPFLTQIRIIITSTDVIHSWTVQSIGVKIDAIPGRLNQISLIINKPGLFFGQCSEICGTNHRFIPITIERININKFISWINNYIKWLK